jgi:four helix bundle protein
MTAQVRRAALSAGSNIAEGVVKHSPREFARFLDMTLGSLSEVSYQVLAARDVGVAKLEDFEQLEPLRDKASRLTWRLRQAVLDRRETRWTVDRRP